MKDPEDEAFEELSLKQGQWEHTSGWRKKQILETSMTRDEVDTMWQKAMQESIKDGEMFTRYHFAKLVAEKALAEHAMRETQRLGQEIEQEPCVHAKTPKGCYRVRCQLGDKCVDDEMSFRTTPPQRKPLTNGEIYTAYITATNQTLRATDERLAFAFARAIESAHNIKD